jgi:hypothetical protein
MLRKFLLPVIPFVFCACLRSQTTAPLFFDLSDKQALLTTLFDSDLMATNGEVLWEPLSFSDRLMVSTSDDSLFHTRLDTILFFSTFGIEQAVAIFATYNYQKNHLNACQACGAQLSFATFDETVTGQWQIERFAKHLTALGSLGENGDIELVQFGENQWCLQLKMGWMGQGILSEHVSFVNLDDFSTIFTFVSHEDNSGVLHLPAERSYSFDRSIHFLNQEQERTAAWWEFDVVSRGTNLSETEELTVPANYVQRYQYDWQTRSYTKACP